MPPTPAIALSASDIHRLRPTLDALCAATDVAARLSRDPLHFPRRYTDPADVEIAGLFASALAFGRVSLFWPVLARITALMDQAGGPRTWALGFGPADAEALAPLIYRWNRGPDWSLLAAAAGRLIREAGTLGAVVEAAYSPVQADLGVALEALILALREAAVAESAALGHHARTFDALPRGLRTLLPLPSQGSACKRWNMYLRWMVRRPGPPGPDGHPAAADGVDLGLWALPPSALIIPLDTHVSRLSGLLGLTARTDDSWRTAVEITANLARFDPADPVRYDFALAHLGISGACRGVADPLACPACPLVADCRIGRVAFGRRSD